MKTQFSLFVLFLVLAQVLAACGTAAPTPSASEPITAPLEPNTTTDAITIVQNYYDAVNKGEFEVMAGLMAEDIVMTYPGGQYSGRQKVLTSNQNSFDAGMRFEISDLKDTDGRVTSCFKVFQKEMLIDQGCTGVTIVRSGQILFDGLAKDEPEYVVQRYYQALNTQDLDLAMSFIAPDAIFINPTGTYEGAEAIRDSLAGLNMDGITFDLSNFRNTVGEVVYDYKVMQGGNMLDQGTNGLTVVEDGKITFDGTEDTQPGAIDPAAIAQAYYQAYNDGDIEAVMALVANDIKCRVGCYLTGKESFRFYVEGDIKRGFQVELSDFQVEGDRVTYNMAVYSKDGFIQVHGVESLQIKDGLIVLMEGLQQ